MIGTSGGAAGLYSDDTQFALCLLQPVFETGRFSPERAACVFARLRAEKARGGFGVFRGTGLGAREAIGRMARSIPWQECGVPSAGNGAAMRAGPLAVYTALRVLSRNQREGRNEKIWPEVARETIAGALLTHRDPRGVSAALAIAAACTYHVEHEGSGTETGQEQTEREKARLFLEYVSERCHEGEQILRDEWETVLLFPVQQKRKRDGRQHKRKENIHRQKNGPRDEQKQRKTADLRVMHQFSAAVRRLSRMVGWNLEAAGQQVVRWAQKLSNKRILHPCQGFSFCSVLMALLIAAQATSYEDAVVTAIGRGGDCDTMGAMVGAIAGTRWGVEAIPFRWRETVANSDALLSRAEHLRDLALGLMVPQRVAEEEEEYLCCCSLHSLEQLVRMELEPLVWVAG